MLEIKKSRTTAYYPAGNGQVENANKTVKSLLMAKVDSEPETFINGINPILAYVWERGTVATRCDDG